MIIATVRLRHAAGRAGILDGRGAPGWAGAGIMDCDPGPKPPRE